MGVYDFGQFMFSSIVTAEELRKSFINTNATSVEQLAEIWSEENYECAPEEAFKWQPFDDLPDGKKYVSFLSRPRVRLDLDENIRLFDKVFVPNIKWNDGFQNYLAILSRTINSAPGGDTLWPYGRYKLEEIDGNVGGKLIGGALFDLNVMRSLREDAKTIEIPWQEIFEFHKLNQNLRDFGLMLCNFKDTLSGEFFQPWEGLISAMSELEESDNPAVDKVAVCQTAFQIVSRYIAVRKNTFDRDQLSQDIQKFKDHLNFKEIQNIRVSDV